MITYKIHQPSPRRTRWLASIVDRTAIPSLHESDARCYPTYAAALDDVLRVNLGRTGPRWEIVERQSYPRAA